MHTHHRLLGVTWLPLGATAHKKVVSPERMRVYRDARFAGSVGTQVVKVFDLVARTGPREHEARVAGRGWTPATTASRPDATPPSTRAPRLSHSHHRR